jgi:hypothetical protein
MESNLELRKQLLALLQGGNAHMPFEDAVAQFPTEMMNTMPPNVPYTPWHLLEHIRLAQWDILEFVRNPKHISPKWPEGYWPARDEQADEAKWANTISMFKADLTDLEGLIKDPDARFFTDLPHAPGYTLLREILLVSDHNAYHLGEFAILRQVMGSWPGNKER